MANINLSYSQMLRYIGNMLGLDLLEEFHEGNHSVSYQITRKGLNLLSAIEDMQEMLRLEKSPIIFNSPYTAKSSSRSSYAI